MNCQLHNAMTHWIVNCKLHCHLNFATYMLPYVYFCACVFLCICVYFRTCVYFFACVGVWVFLCMCMGFSACVCVCSGVCSDRSWRRGRLPWWICSWSPAPAMAPSGPSSAPPWTWSHRTTWSHTGTSQARGELCYDSAPCLTDQWSVDCLGKKNHLQHKSHKQTHVTLQ